MAQHQYFILRHKQRGIYTSCISVPEREKKLASSHESEVHAQAKPVEIN